MRQGVVFRRCTRPSALAAASNAAKRRREPLDARGRAGRDVEKSGGGGCTRAPDDTVAATMERAPRDRPRGVGSARGGQLLNVPLDRGPGRGAAASPYRAIRAREDGTSRGAGAAGRDASSAQVARCAPRVFRGAARRRGKARARPWARSRVRVRLLGRRRGAPGRARARGARAQPPRARAPKRCRRSRSRCLVDEERRVPQMIDEHRANVARSFSELRSRTVCGARRRGARARGRARRAHHANRATLARARYPPPRPPPGSWSRDSSLLDAALSNDDDRTFTRRASPALVALTAPSPGDSTLAGLGARGVWLLERLVRLRRVSARFMSFEAGCVLATMRWHG